MAQETQIEQENSEQTDLEGSVKVGGTEIEAVQDDTNREILGWIVPFTIGNDFVVPRMWLEARARELNLSPNLLPSRTSRKQAFTRAGTYVERRDVAEIELDGDVEIHLDKVKYEYTYRVEVHDRRDENEFEGELLGTLDYDAERETVVPSPSIGQEHEMWRAWNSYIDEFRDEWDVQRESHLGSDIRSMIVRFFQRRSQSVKFRAGGGVYFAPAAAGDVVQALDQLVSDIDQEHKKAGFPCELDSIEVADSDEKKSMVEEKVRRDLEEQVSDLLEDAFDDLADEDTLVDDLLGEVEAELDDVEGFADQYNALLDAEMTVREYLEQWRQQVTGEAEDLVEQVLDEQDDEPERDENGQFV